LLLLDCCEKDGENDGLCCLIFYYRDSDMMKLIKNIIEFKGIFPKTIVIMLKKLLIIVGVIALFMFGFFGLHAGLSVILGALCVMGGIIVSIPIAYKSRNTQQASRVIIDALKAEAVKILIIVILLWITFTVYEEKVPIAIVLGIAIAAIFSGIAISRQETK